MARKARNPAESKEIENSLFAQSRLGREELFAELGTSEVGLNTVEADERLERFGPNVIEAGHQRTLWEKLAGAVINPFNVVLLIVLGVTVVTDIVISREKTYSTSALILATILISAYIGYSQEEKSNDAAQKLRKMITNKVDVIRNRLPVVVDITDVVPGDIVKLSSGDMLPGDVRFFEAKDLFVDQSSLTGESYPVEKFTDVKAGDSLTSLDNIGFLGTNVVSGSALAVVLSTGSRTYFGSMAKSLSTDKEVSDFEKGISSISRLLIRFMLVMVPVIFAVNLLTKANLVESILFGITITVGLIPEMLPVITTSTLAKGALDMSRRKTIIKKLSSIQTFGEMDVLCTDKTGTLTRDKIILEKYMDVEGNEDLSILGYAFLNSWFQTGLNNLIDLAIISRAEGEGLNHLK
ncbi:MAG TPA: HAD-IC family P-type ATPase, partial [Candidatus Limnocylindria bacterium]|nr:HAD-IC family P-type ATPase [Candidatus Limnocylindria bacterium]